MDWWIGGMSLSFSHRIIVIGGEASANEVRVPH